MDALGIEVKDWGETDSNYPREVVEVVLVLAPIVIPALTTIIKAWIKQRKIKSVTIKRPDGTELAVENLSRRDLKEIIDATNIGTTSP